MMSSCGDSSPGDDSSPVGDDSFLISTICHHLRHGQAALCSQTQASNHCVGGIARAKGITAKTVTPKKEEQRNLESLEDVLRVYF
jgi:hypothetical protein